MIMRVQNAKIKNLDTLVTLPVSNFFEKHFEKRFYKTILQERFSKRFWSSIHPLVTCDNQK